MIIELECYFRILAATFLVFVVVFFICIIFGYLRCVIQQEIQIRKEKKERETQKTILKGKNDFWLITLWGNSDLRRTMKIEADLLKEELVSRGLYEKANLIKGRLK